MIGSGTVSRASPAQVERARRLLVHEGAARSAADCATAAGRLCDELQAALAPLVGAAGVQALLHRSAKLARREFPFLEVGGVTDSAQLRACLQAQAQAVATEAAAALFGTFFTLITTFIGERLTIQVLRRAWPTMAEAALTETKT